MTEQTYNEILKVWNDNATDDFAIFSPLYYETLSVRKVTSPTPPIQHNQRSSVNYHWSELFPLYPTQYD